MSVFQKVECTYPQIAMATLGKMIEILSYSLTVYLNAGW